MATRTAHSAWWRPVPPRWLTPAVAAWLVIATAALGNSTPVPVSGPVLLVLFALLAVAHGRVHRRWRIAGPSAAAALALALAAAGAAEWLPGMDMTWDSGPAGSVAVQAIWITLTVIAALDIAWALRVHGRRATAAGATPPDATGAARVQRELDAFDRRLSAVEELLTRVP